MREQGRPDQSPEQTRRGAVLLLAAGTMMTAIGLNIYVPVLSPYAEQLGASVLLVGLIGGSYGFVQLLTRVPLGLMSDRGKQRQIVVAAPVCAALGCLGLGLSRQPQLFLGWRGLAGLGGAALVAFPSAFVVALGPVRTERATSTFMLSYNSGQVIGFALGGELAQRWGWGAPFFTGLVLAVSGVVLLALVAVSPRPQEPDSRLRTWDQVRLIWDPAMLPTLGHAAVGTFAMNALYTFVPVRAAGLGASRSQWGMLIATTMAAVPVANVVSGSVLTKRIGTRWVAATGMGLLALGPLVLASVDRWELLLAAQLVAGLGYGLFMPLLLAAMLDAKGASQQDTVSGAFMWYAALGTFAGPVAGGVVADRLGLNAAFLGIGMLCLLAGIYLLSNGLGTVAQRTRLD